MTESTPTSRDHAIAPVYDFLHNALNDAVDEATQKWGHDLTTSALRSLIDSLFFEEVPEETAELILALVEEEG